MDDLLIKLNFRDKKPISVQLQDELHRLIQAGVIAPGSQLPTVRELAAKLRINFNTVARVYRVLDQEGIISTRQGRGSYLIESTSPHAQEGEQPHAQIIAQFIDTVIEKANRLEITPEQLVALLKQKALPGAKIKSISVHKRAGKGNKKRLGAPFWMRETREAGSKPRTRLAGRKHPRSSS